MEPALRILVVDDSESDVKLMERVLRAGDVFFALRRVETREEFQRAIASDRPDVILVDYRLPHFDGLTALRDAKRLSAETPVIVVTGSLSDELAVEFMQEGASDYIIKDRGSRLASAVKRVVEETRVKVERRELEEKYRALHAGARAGLAIVDCQTGRLSECNESFFRLTGRASAQLAELKAWDLGEPALQAALRDAAAGKAFTLRGRIPAGAAHDLEITGTPIILGGRPHVQLALREAALTDG